jgi:iron complex outermembrane receptor protein
MGVDVTTKPGLYASMTYFYKDKMPITSTGATTGLATIVPYHATSYSLFNAKIGFRRTFATHFDIDVNFAINNITNTKYPIMVFSNQLPDAYMAGPIKANYFGGLTFKYIF